MARVLLVADFGAYGGTRTYFNDLVEFYGTEGHELIVAVAPNQVDSAFGILLARAGCRYHLLPERAAHFRRLWHRLPFAVLFELYALIPILWKERPDLLVFSSAVPGHYLGAVLLPFRFLYIDHTVPAGTSMSRIERLLFSRCLGSRKRLLAVSKFGKQRMEKYWLTPGKQRFVSVIHNSAADVDPNPTISSPAEGGVLRVLTIGHVTWYKNPAAWIQVARQVIEATGESVEFVWVGDGDMYEECRMEVQRQSLDQIRFVGFHSDVSKFYSSSAVYFQPSLLENHSLAVLGAMRWGLPCVVSDTGGLPESVLDGETGYVVGSNDIEAMTARITELLKDPALRRHMACAAQRRCESEFSRETWRRRMSELHCRLLSGLAC